MRNAECVMRNWQTSLIPHSAFPCASTHAASHSDLELRLQSAHRAAAHEDPELPGLDDELHVLVVEAQLLRRELEVYCARFTRFEGDATESGQRAHRPRDARDFVVHVELHHLGTLAAAAVRHRDRSA